MSQLTHFDEQGASRMVDTSSKPETERLARARCRVQMLPTTVLLMRNKGIVKGDVFEVARLAGIMAAKKTSDLIPLCHPLSLTSICVDFSYSGEDSIDISATVRSFGRTGVEMEAMTAVTVSALTIYDMCKSVDRAMTITQVQLIEKTGGKTGTFVRHEPKE